MRRLVAILIALAASGCTSSGNNAAVWSGETRYPGATRLPALLPGHHLFATGDPIDKVAEWYRASLPPDSEVKAPHGELAFCCAPGTKQGILLVRIHITGKTFIDFKDLDYLLK